MYNNVPPLLLFGDNDSHEVTEKRHRTAYTSSLSFKELNESGQRETEKQKAIELLQKSEPLTSRQVACLLKVERTNITRTLRDLQDDGKVKVAFLSKCEKTGKTVNFYTAAQ